ncbi:MAG: replicative DNA helicase [Erysipelotrichaceae bacterium]|nr:replicative DNA helicase [Erysipelotrichaceae bacterium]MDD3924290.1 replicative DNA helicase [Erysipelotrichaceae bacterium]MDD4642505.1 replicative DNA helicase [Erysipelotrichaceae bacterium]
MTRRLPSSIETEMALLGTMMIYPSAIKMAFEEGLIKEDFFVEANQRIYNAIMSLHEEGKPVDLTALSSRLNDLQELNRVGGMDYMMQLADAAVSGANTKYYVQLIQDKAYLRNLIQTAEQIAEEGFESQYNLDEVMDNAERSILTITRNRRATEFKSSHDVVADVLENVQAMRKNHSLVVGMKTSFRDLDYYTNGFQNSDLIILAARPSVGKTAFALNLAMNMAEANKLPVALFSLEMGAEQLVSRMLSAKSEVKGQLIRTGYMNNKEMNQVIEAASILRELPIYIDDSATIKVSDIFSKCRKLKVEKGLGAIVIDYIQLITGSNRRFENRQQEVSEISRGLKALARELNVPVIALSQLSRLVEQRGEDKKPKLSDLRESGALEQDADIVLFLYRKDYHDRNKTNDEQKYEEASVSVNPNKETEIIIAKHRNGPTGSVFLSFNLDYNAFYDMDKGYMGDVNDVR